MSLSHTILEYSKIFNEKLIDNGNQSIQIRDFVKRHSHLIGKYFIRTKTKTTGIKKILKKLKNNKSAWLSQIPNETFKYCGEKYTELVSGTLSAIITYHYVPQKMNLGLMTAIIKDSKDSLKSISNTRSITLSETMAFILEYHLLEKIEVNYKDDDSPFGFKENSSTTHGKRNKPV